MSMTAGERRIVSVLVADVAGSTGIGESLGPERSKFLFDEVVRLMRDEVERLGGTVAQLTGDGVLALFGAPTAHENDAERAVRAALAIHEALAGYGKGVEEAYGVALAARVAVNTGPVVLQPEEGLDHERYNALGDTVNVAARLQEAAGRGGVALGPATARQVERAFELEPLGELELKGKSAPVAAFRVAAVRQTALAPAERPLVGRERDITELAEAFELLADGRGVIVSVSGEPGIGKSRLVAEARREYEGRVLFLEGNAVLHTATIPYWPVRDLLRSWLGLGGSDPEARVRLELKAGLSALGEDANESYPFLATLLGLPLDSDDAQRVGELSRDSVQRQTLDAVADLVRTLSRERPVCLVLEDLHWADQSTLELLEELLALTDEEATGLVLLYRSDPDQPSWALADRAHRRFRHRHTALELEPLDDDASRALAAGVAGGELPEPVAALLAERSGGNPFSSRRRFAIFSTAGRSEGRTAGSSSPSRSRR